MAILFGFDCMPPVFNYPSCNSKKCISHANNGRVIGCDLPSAISGKGAPNDPNPSGNSQSLHGGRRQVVSCALTAMVLHSGLPLRWAAAAESKNNPKNELIQKLLERSNANKAKYDKERLDSYYKRNYKDYFEFVEGSVQNKKGNLSEAEKEILEWLRKNR